MTTIAYRDGVIAYDSRVTRDSNILTDDAEKMIERNGVAFFFTGSTCDQEKLIAGYFGEHVENVECSAFVVDNGVIWTVGNDGTETWRCPTYEYGAMGSGEDHAMTAMDMGADAKQAVEMAAKRDSRTGGVIRVYEVSDGLYPEQDQHQAA